MSHDYTTVGRRAAWVAAIWMGLASVSLGPSASAQVDPATGARTDYYNPMAVAGRPDTNTTRWRHVTICDNEESWVWKRPFGKIGEAEARVTNTDPKPPEGHSHPAAGRSNGTDGSAEIWGKTVGDSNLEIKTDGLTIHLLVHVIRCDRANHGHRGVV